MNRREFIAALERLSDFLMLIWALCLYGSLLLYWDFKAPWRNALIIIRPVIALGINYGYNNWFALQIRIRQLRRIPK